MWTDLKRAEPMIQPWHNGQWWMHKWNHSAIDEIERVCNLDEFATEDGYHTILESVESSYQPRQLKSVTSWLCLTALLDFKEEIGGAAMVPRDWASIKIANLSEIGSITKEHKFPILRIIMFLSDCEDQRIIIESSDGQDVIVEPKKGKVFVVDGQVELQMKSSDKPCFALIANGTPDPIDYEQDIRYYEQNS